MHEVEPLTVDAVVEIGLAHLKDKNEERGVLEEACSMVEMVKKMVNMAKKGEDGSSSLMIWQLVQLMQFVQFV
ncbi:hypothetical protein A0H81_01579 [Grifola frondosa]|uniref:Uncharacterized protein n=1 Tax=Grifola frondosa TaxID=5627 RepID=A0A1C7MU51_GRIFR|nr:hypothetical protein A0H81_01579 [Grifola frondosa]